MTRWLRATEYSPICPNSPDEVVVIGPFEDKDRLEAFLDRHDRVFSSKVEVYTPDDYDAEAETLAAEVGGDGKRSYGPLV